jgi:phage terminase large subunit GpA-like protein
VTAHPNARLLVAQRLESTIRPAAPLPFSKWLPENIVLVDGPNAGMLWSLLGAPYLAEIADCLSDDHPCNEVDVRKSQQSGVSILALAWALYVADREPANFIYAAPNIDLLRDLNSQKLQPLIDAWQKRIKRTVIYPQTSRSSMGSTTYEKKFAGGYLALANANAVTDLSSKTAKKGVKDEVSKWQDIPGYGDPEKLFFGRFTAFRRLGDYKILGISTPEVDTGADDPDQADGHCRIDRAFQRSDRRFWHVPCPGCGEHFVHRFERLRIDEVEPHKSVYEHECGYRLTEAERVVAVRAGKWIATNPGPGRQPGFHIDAFISLMMSYGEIAKDWLASRTETEKKAFYNLVLGLPYKYRGDAPEWERLKERVEPHLRRGHVPPRGLLLIGFADVQMRGLWLNIVAFAPNGESWDVDALYIDGDTSKFDGTAFQQLRKETLDRKFPDAFGQMRKLDALGLDSGFRAHVVYSWVRRHQQVHPISGRDVILATKGLDGWGRPAIGMPSLVDIDLDGKKIRQGAKVWGVGTWPLKASFYSDLRQEIPTPPAEPIAPDGYCHFGTWNDEVFFKQITAEQLEDVKHKGRVTHQKWATLRENHLLDCRVGIKALAEYLGISSTTPEQWAALARERGLPAELSEATLFTPRDVAKVVDPAEAAAVEKARKEAERESVRDVSPDAVGFLEGYNVKF